MYEKIYISDYAVNSLIYGFFILFTTYVAGSRVLGFPDAESLARSYQPPKRILSNYLLAAFILQTFVIVILILFYLKTGSIPLFHEDADNFRVEARKGFGSIIVLCRAISDIFISSYALHVFKGKRYRQCKKLTFIFAVYYLITLALFLGLGSRAPVFDFILLLFVIRYWLMRSKVNYQLVVLGVFLFLLLGLIGAVRQGRIEDQGALVVIAQAVWRPYANIQNWQWVLDSFPNERRILNGSGYLTELETLLPGYQPNFGTWFKERFGYEFSGGSVTVTYLGELYANYGRIGVIFGPAIYAIILLLITGKFIKKRNYVSTFCLLMMSMSLKGIINVGFVATIVSTVLPMVCSMIAYFLIAEIVNCISFQRIRLNG